MRNVGFTSLANGKLTLVCQLTHLMDARTTLAWRIAQAGKGQARLSCRAACVGIGRRGLARAIACPGARPQSLGCLGIREPLRRMTWKRRKIATKGPSHHLMLRRPDRLRPWHAWTESGERSPA